MRVFTAEPAAHAAVDDGRDRIGAQRIRVVLHREGRAAGEPDAGVIARAGVFVDAVLHAHMALAFREPLRYFRLEAALPLELALALGDDHLESAVIGLH